MKIEALDGWKKIIATGIAMAITLANRVFGWGLDGEALAGLLAPLAIYVVGQALADNGKVKAQIEQDTVALTLGAIPAPKAKKPRLPKMESPV
jgi:hypothetical protein